MNYFSVTEIKSIKLVFIYRRAQEGEKGKLLESQKEDWGVYGFQLIFNQNHKALGSDFKEKTTVIGFFSAAFHGPR